MQRTCTKIVTDIEDIHPSRNTRTTLVTNINNDVFGIGKTHPKKKELN